MYTKMIHIFNVSKISRKYYVTKRGNRCENTQKTESWPFFNVHDSGHSSYYLIITIKKTTESA